MFSFILLALLTSTSLAAPAPDASQGISVPLQKRTAHHPRNRTPEWLVGQANKLKGKYNPNLTVAKRSQGVNELVNLNADQTYFGSLAIGTPAVPFNVILDTGSSDLWVAGGACASCQGVPIFDPTASSTAQNLSTAFSIKYGSGAASGDLFSDTVQMAGFELDKQVFAVVDNVSANLLDSPISGLLGLAWQAIASSGAPPLVQALASQSGTLTAPLFGFFLTRFLDILTTEDAAQQNGGEFALGFANTDLFTGDIEFAPIPAGREAFWTLAISGITVQGNAVPIPSGEQFAAIDTGTTLVGGPADMIAAVYAQIPGSSKGTGSTTGYYEYPCATNVTVTFAFGGRNWPISSEDFELMQVSHTNCVGALFEIDLGSSPQNPDWIIGDTFLKNVYSVFQFEPPQVGFAQLSTAAAASDVVGLPLPSQTVAADPVRTTTLGGTRAKNAAVGRRPAAALALLLLPTLALLW